LDSFSELVRELTPKLNAVAAYYLREEAEDAVQEVWEKAFKHKELLDGVENKVAWLVVVTKRHCIDNIRKRKKTEDFISPLPYDEFISAVTSDDEPGERCLNKEAGEIILRYVRSINENLGLPVKLFYYDGLSVKEIAEAMDITESAAKWRLFAGRQMIKKNIIKEGYFVGKTRRD